MNQYIYTVQPVRIAMLFLPENDEAEALAQHKAYQQQLMQNGSGILSGALTVRDSRQFGLFVFQAEDDESAKAIMHADPAIQSRVMRGRLFPFRISLWNYDAAAINANPSYFIYLIQPSRPEMLTDFTEFEGGVMGQHFAYLQDLTEQGVFCCVGPCLNTDYSNFGLGILRADSIESAWAISENDPAVQHRVMRLDVQPFELNAISATYSG